MEVPSNTPKSSFHAKFINPTTAVILEDDIYLEQPLIYIKIYLSFLLITDTGTSHPRLPNNKPSLTLRQYLETIPITPFSPKHQPQPLNPSGNKRYLIICTHAHYDHILGIPSFLDSKPSPIIIASGNDPSFILEDFPTHSLCKYLDNISTPIYTVNHWTKHLEFLPNPSELERGRSEKLAIRILHIPGHTPDSLAWYDIDEGWLFVGDMFYTRKRNFSPDVGNIGNELCADMPEQDAAILFPAEGNWIHYMASLDLILSFVEFQNQKLKERSGNGTVQRVKVGCGHVTFAGDAEVMVREVKGLFMRILEGRVEIVRSFVKRGEVFDVWDEGSGSKYFVGAPRRLCEEARRRG